MSHPPQEAESLRKIKALLPGGVLSKDQVYGRLIRRSAIDRKTRKETISWARLSKSIMRHEPLALRIQAAFVVAFLEESFRNL